jgi:hypothetical protein
VRTINADYSHRFSTDFIRDSYASLEEAFEQGNFVLVADRAEDGSELQGMAFVLAGLADKGVRVLSDRRGLSERAKVILAFGLWFLDRPRSALSVLQDCSTDGSEGFVAAELRRLIAARRINVIQIDIPPPRQGDVDFADPLWSGHQQIGQFCLRNAATQGPNDSSVEDDFSDFVNQLPDDEKPDFILAMVNHWFVPRNLDKSGIPLVRWTHDQDHFVHRNYDNFRLCDLNIVTTSQEHFEMSRGCGVFSASNLLTDPFSASYEDTIPAAKEKDVDILFTSTGFDFFFSDKSRFLFNVSRLSEEFNLRFVDGRLPYNDYIDTMSRARFVPVVSRVCGNPSPRWREALASGSFLLYPAHTMFGRVTAGCHPYRGKNFVEDIRRHLQNARSSSDAAYDHDAVLRRVDQDFAPHRTTRELQRERFLRFAAFMLVLKRALKWQQASPVSLPPPRRRLVWLAAHTTIHCFGAVNTIKKVDEIARRIQPAKDWQDTDYNNLALTLHSCALLMHMQGAETQLPDVKKTVLLERAKAIMAEGLRQFPNSMLLRFNVIQWLVVEDAVLGVPLRAGIIEAFQRFIDDFQRLDFDPLNADVANQHFYMYDRVFPHFSYGQLVVKYAVARRHPDMVLPSSLPDPKLVLLGAAHGYIGFAKYSLWKDREAITHFDAALAAFPENQPLLDLRFACFKRLVISSWQRADLDDRLIEAFFDIADVWPVILLKEVAILLPIMRRRQRIDELSALLHDWYRYAKTLDERSLQKYLPPESAAAILKYEAYFPAGLSAAVVKEQHFGPVPLSPLEGYLIKIKHDIKNGKLLSADVLSTEPWRWLARRFYNYIYSTPIYRRIYQGILPFRYRHWIRSRLLPAAREGLQKTQLSLRSLPSFGTLKRIVATSATQEIPGIEGAAGMTARQGATQDQIEQIFVENANLNQSLMAKQAELADKQHENDMLKTGGGRDFSALERDVPLSPPAVYRFEELIEWAKNEFEITAQPVPLVFVHVQKTGGIFLNNILVRNYRQRLDSYGAEFFTKLYPEEFYTYIQPPNRDDTGRPAFFTGHIDLGNEIFSRMRGRYIGLSLLRDPVERMVSHYLFHRGLPNNYLNASIHRDNLDVVAYFRRFPEIPRQIDSFLTTNERAAGDAVDIALNNIDTKLSIFGLQERMDEFLVQLSYFLGFPNILYRKPLNVSQSESAVFPVGSDDREKLAELMSEDIALYRRAQALYQDRLSRIPADVAALVKEFRRLNEQYRSLSAGIEAMRGRRHPWTDGFA